MRGHLTIKTAGLSCRFSNIGSDNIYSDCCMKADPWRIAPVEKPDITVEERLREWSPAGCTLLSEETLSGHCSRVYRGSDGMLYFSLWNGENSLLICWQVDTAAEKVTLLVDNTHTAGYFAFEHAGTVLPALFLKHGLCTMHGVLLEYQNRGMILTADSGVGKTTHARLWRDHKGAIVLNGDRITFGKTENQWVGYGLPWSGGSGEQLNRSATLRAIVQIVRGNENRAERLQGTEAFTVVLGQLLTPAWDAHLAGIALDMAQKLTEEVPVWRLFCTPEKEAADVLEQALF